MKKKHTPEKTTSARTTFELTDEDTVEALVAYVEHKIGKLPDGFRTVWVRNNSESFREGRALTTLVIDHNPNYGEE